MCYNVFMIYSVNCAMLSTALLNLKKIIKNNEAKGVKTVVFCEDRLTLAAERTVCAAVGGTFSTSVYTFARFLSTENGKPDRVLSGQGSAMAVRKIIEENKQNLKLFKKLSTAAAAKTVYDTIALLYSSRVSAADAAKAAEGGGLLGGKLHDVAIIYAAYENYLKESGFQDRNGYLRQLPEVIEKSPKIRGNAVVFLGFQALTCTSQECVRAAFSAADCVYGLFIGGREDIYVNEAGAAFNAIAAEYGGAKSFYDGGAVLPEADKLRRSVFNPESFYAEKLATDRVRVLEATDGEEELEFIAATIKGLVRGGERYAKISVMLPDLDGGGRALARVFSRYKIPYYADRRLSLSEHPLTGFIINFIGCALSGCRFADLDKIIASPFFPAAQADKDIFRNYALRLANFRGGVKRKPDVEILESLGFDFGAVERVRETFLKGLSLIPLKGGNSAICGGIRQLLQLYGVENTLKNTAETYKDERPAAAQFSLRAFGAVTQVLDEAENIAADASPSEFIKILKSGFSAAEISLIPPKADAVFVGDLAATANTGSNVVFAARLTGEVPEASADTSLLTDREISALEGVNLNISPKIRQVNARRRETVALNICAFRERLYLSYPTRLDGEESGASEIITYALNAFLTGNGNRLAPLDIKSLEKNAAFYCCEKLPAIRWLRKYSSERAASSVYEFLKRAGFEDQAEAAVKIPVKRNISCGQRLYFKNDGLSPTTLETYFTCPYLCFIRQGLKAYEREEGAMRAVDAGNFIHEILQELAASVAATEDKNQFETLAVNLAEEKLSKAPYSSLVSTKSGEYAAGELISKAVKISLGMYDQLKNSSFVFSRAESAGEVRLDGGAKVYGRIDRVDESGGLVRVIDYKTGVIDASATKYYMGTKLQLPLYLLAAANGKRAAGAYYFPASVEYREKNDGVFRLQGFMDGGDDVVLASDSSVQPKQKSAYVEAYYQGRRLDNVMTGDDFSYFLKYSTLIAEVGVKEMKSGNIAPSPVESACSYCRAGGSCGLSLNETEERACGSVKCADVVEIVRKETNNGTD